VLREISLDPHTSPAKPLDLRGHALLGQSLAVFPARIEPDVHDCDIRPERGEPQRVGATEAACCSRDDSGLARQLACYCMSIHGDDLIGKNNVSASSAPWACIRVNPAR
jgi:hypothetical protein